MAESQTHFQLVQRLVEFVGGKYGDLVELYVRDDSVTPLRAERPPLIGGYVPDLYATDVPTTKTLIGEAKTTRDLETAHSTSQISAFLEFLKYTPNSTFVLSVPVGAAATGRRLLWRLSTRVANDTTKLIVLNGLEVSNGGYKHDPQ